jgi:transcriptional regulator with XRE-family HTH domain
MYTNMIDAELKIIREALGLTGDNLASMLDVSPRTVRNWEQGKYPIPDGVSDEVHTLLVEMQISAHLSAMDLKNKDNPTITVYRTDEEYRQHNPDGPRCAGWTRAHAARVFQMVPNLRIRYTD